MKEETFSLVSSLEANYLNIELQEPAEPDEIAIRVMKEDCPEFLIPFRIVNINGRITFKYQLSNTVALEYSDHNLHKKDFVMRYLNLLIPFVKGRDWFLDYHYYCIDPRYIYLDRRSANALFIYIPERTYRNTDEEIISFFRDTFTGMTILDDAGFQVKLYRFFSGREITLSGLYQLLQQEIDTAAASVAITPARGMSMGQDISAPADVPAVMPLYAAPVQTPEKKSSPIMSQTATAGGEDMGETDAVVEALFGSGRKKGTKKTAEEKQTKEKPAKEKPFKKKEGGFQFFGKKKTEIMPAVPSGSPEAQRVQQSIPVPPFGGFVTAEDGNDQTEISAEGGMALSACMELMDSSVPGAVPSISLEFTQPYVILGRMSSDEVQPDIAFSREFTHIGRRHARIEKRNGIYYIIDLGSANHTLLDGQILIPNQAYPLTDGSILTLTNSRPVRYRIHI